MSVGRIQGVIYGRADKVSVVLFKRPKVVFKCSFSNICVLPINNHAL